MGINANGELEVLAAEKALGEFYAVKRSNCFLGLGASLLYHSARANKGTLSYESYLPGF